MYLQKLELQGFKSFANRTELEFLGPKAGTKGITAIVGPNGSGKSNVADGIRWVLGEQSMKLLRGKKSEDVIFSGSEKRARSGFAEVSMLLNNEDRKADIEYPELLITRRLYRDGTSEYLVNKQKTRLTDIQLLLARASFGERHYSVIGQGMIEQLLQLSPEERREFFEEASGVKPLELKKDQALGKLESAEENLRTAEGLIREIEPRMRSLSRQAKRLEDRGTIEEELHGLQHAYYGSLWKESNAKCKVQSEKLREIEGRLAKKRAEAAAIETEFSKLEKEETRSDAFLKLQLEYQKLVEERSALREKEFEARGAIDRARSGTVAVPLPISRIISELQAISALQDETIERLTKATSMDDVRGILNETKDLAKRTRDLLDRLERPAPGKTDTSKTERELSGITEKMKDLAGKLADIQKRIEAAGKEEAGRKGAFFEAQRRLQGKQEELYAVDRELSEARIELARLETRREALENEMATELKERLERVKHEVESREAPSPTAKGPLPQEEIQAKIQKLKYQLELIGGIDPEVIKEYTETNERWTFLTTQVDDLRKSITDLETVIVELNRLIEIQFSETFERINEAFGRYFKILFNGGQAKLERKRVAPTHKREEEELEEGVEPTKAEERPPSIAEKFAAEEFEIEIHASPPGKRIKSLAMLSGGERSLSAIALISAIIAVNPSPFVVLDEVDAALDESNSIRFAQIVRELSSQTQFIVITHNRYTMEHSSTLYGVTMRDDGTSQLLSVKLEDIKR